MKGDFPECVKCTSFQCKTCGLDQIGEGTGDVSFSWTMIKFNLFMIFIAIIDSIFHFDKTPMPWSITISNVISMFIFGYVKNEKEHNNNDGFGLITFIGVIIGIGPFAFFVYRSIMSYK